MAEKRKQVWYSILPDILERVDNLAAQDKRPPSIMAEILLEEALNARDRKAKDAA